MPTVSAGGVSAGEAPPLPGQAAKADKWLVAIVKRNSEKTSRDSLCREGYEAYVATQTIMRRFAKRRPKPVEYVRIPAKVFLRMAPPRTGQARTEFFLKHPYISSFMTDRAKGNRTWAEIPDSQMRQMRHILGDTENEVNFGFPDESYTIGGKVKAVGGLLNGLEGIVASRDSKDYFCVEIQGLDWARISISRDKLELVEKDGL